jgi:hypothetical protein
MPVVPDLHALALQRFDAGTALHAAQRDVAVERRDCARLCVVDLAARDLPPACGALPTSQGGTDSGNARFLAGATIVS